MDGKVAHPTHTPWRRVVIALTAGVCVALSAAATAHAAPTWLPAKSLRSPIGSGSYFSYVQAASDPAGNTVVVWDRYDAPTNTTVIEAAFRPAGGSFGAAQLISGSPSPTSDAYSPDVGMDAQGRALVVWVQEVGANRIVRSRTRDANGSFGAIVPLMGLEPGNDAAQPQVAVNGSGRAAVVWARQAPNQVYGTTGSIGGGFPPASQLSAAGSIYGPTVAVDAAGNALFAWERDLADRWLVETLAKPVSASFGPVVQLSPDPTASQQAFEYAELPRVAFDPSGRAIVVWSYWNLDVNDDGVVDPSGPQVIQYANRSVSPTWAAGGFTTAGTIPAADTVSNGRPDVVVDAANTAVVAWNGGPGVQSASRPSGQGFGNHQTLSGPGIDTFGVDITMGPSGDAVASWQGFDNASRRAVQAARRPAGVGSSFGAVDEDVEVLSPPPGGFAFTSTPELASDNEGNAIGVWYSAVCDNGGNCTYTPRYAGFDVAPPTLFSASVPGSGVAGQPIGMAAAAGDRWSGAGIHWDFGDGGAADGGGVAHAYSLPGTYNVTVTAGDAVGNARSTTRTVQVQPAAVPPPPPPPKRIVSSITVAWSVLGKRTTITRLLVRQLPSGARVQLRCSGKRCPFKSKRAARPRRGQVNALKALGKKRTMRSGQTLEVRITKSGWIGKVARYKMRTGKQPKSSGALCIPIGRTRAQRRC